MSLDPSMFVIDDDYNPFDGKKGKKRRKSSASKARTPKRKQSKIQCMNAEEEKPGLWYTWKSRAQELYERIEVQKAILYQVVYYRKTILSPIEMPVVENFLKKLRSNDFVTPDVTRFQQYYFKYFDKDGNYQEIKSMSITKEEYLKNDILLKFIRNFYKCIPIIQSQKEKINIFLSLNRISFNFKQIIQFGLSVINEYCYQRCTVNDIVKIIESDNEAYNFHFHAGPYAARSYQTIDDYIATDNIDEVSRTQVMNKMKNINDIHCTCTSPCSTTLNHITWQFESSCSCAAHNQACNDHCTCCHHDTTTSSCLCSNPINNYNSLHLNSELTLHDSWGIDAYTRLLIQLILHTIKMNDETITVFLQKHLLPSFSLVPSDRASDMRNTLIYLLSRNIAILPCITILQAFMHLGPEHFKVHPKGKGVTCTKKGGISANSIICKYLGEVYPAWYWYEKQDILKLKLKELGMEHNLPEFYNIVLERPVQSEGGYDVLFIEPIFKGNFGSRLSHSCSPNCATTTVTIDGQLAIVLVALRDIDYGEELTFDYSCVSESQEEFKEATCLCGSLRCRGSFVYYNDDNSFMQIMSKTCPFLSRMAIVLDSTMHVITDEDKQLLLNVGIKSCMLSDCPSWLINWTVLTLRYMLYEEQALPYELIELKDALQRPLYDTIQAAKNEAKGVFMNRLQNLAISLDRVKHFMTHQQCLQSTSCLHFLTEDEVNTWLWFDKESIINKLIRIGLTCCDSEEEKQCFIQLKLEIKNESKYYHNSSLIRKTLSQFVHTLSQLSIHYNKSCHQACADLLLFYIYTKHWFVTEHYETYPSNYIAIHAYDIPCSCAETYHIQETVNETNQLKSVKSVNSVNSITSMNSVTSPTVNAMTTTSTTTAVPTMTTTSTSSVPTANAMTTTSTTAVPTVPTMTTTSTSSVPTVNAMTTTSSTTAVPTTSSTTAVTQVKKEEVIISNESSSSTTIIVSSPSPSPSPSPSCQAYYVGKQAIESTDEARWNNLSETERLNESNRIIALQQKNYNLAYLWHQLCYWYQQESNESSVVINNNRKGCLLLPSFESCYKNCYYMNRVYSPSYRGKLIHQMEFHPMQPWSSLPWSFNIPKKVYGSPMLDAARGEWDGLNKVIEELKQSQYMKVEYQENEQKEFEKLKRCGYPHWNV